MQSENQKKEIILVFDLFLDGRKLIGIGTRSLEVDKGPRGF